MSSSGASKRLLWRDDLATRTVYATDNSIYQVEPARVGEPTSAGQIAAALRDNYRCASPHPIVARGGGTGTNGQSLTTGLCLDVKRHLNRIVSTDTQTRTVVVQPGLVAAELNAAVAEYGLFWPPHTSTLNRATVGGMISTDAAGKGSLVHGRTHRHVQRLVVLLDDGTEWVAEPVTVKEARRRAERGGRGGEIWQALLDIEVDADLGLPELARGFSGYGLDRLRADGMINPIALVCGAEGTLGIIVEATLTLAPVPEAVRLVVANYDSFDAALRDALDLRETGPVAIETLDETTLACGRASPAWPAIGSVIGDDDGAVLLLEYAAQSAADGRAIEAVFEATGRSRNRHVIHDVDAQAAVWKVRADAVGLLAKAAIGDGGSSARPIAFVEDCAVPVESMPEFIAEFRQMLDGAGLTYAMFGHADVGCVHVRPALDLTSANHRAMMAELTGRVVRLVSRHGGILWGEHGRGFRGSPVAEVLPAATVELMRTVKTAFDPKDLFNPGKLYRPLGNETPLTTVDEPPVRGAFDAEVPVAIRRDYETAFACNGNGLCHHYDADEVMCPSYKATGDPALSPRGRVDLLRRWLRGDSIDAEFEQALVDNLDQCLSCGACTGHCPVEVDIPELKSRFLHQYHHGSRRSVAHHAMRHFEHAAVAASRFPRLARLGIKPAQRVLGLVDLPAPRVRPAAQLPKFATASPVDVVVMPDVFTSTLEPDTLIKSVAVLERVGYSVAVADFVGSGKYDHVKGNRERFAAAVSRQQAAVRRISEFGAQPVVIEPAVALLHEHEYPALQVDYPSGVVASLADLLAARADRLPRVGEGRSIRLLGHCTERATAPERANAWVTVLQAVGYHVEAPDVGCCGMAGVFGHERANQNMSERLWDLSWSGQLESDINLTATGYSCRSQAKRFAGVDLAHPLHWLG